MRHFHIRAFFLLLICLMVTAIPAICESENATYVYLKEIPVIIQFPEEVFAITRDSQPTDPFFRDYGTEMYEDVMAEFEDTSFHLEAVNLPVTWDISIHTTEIDPMFTEFIKTQTGSRMIAELASDQFVNAGGTVSEYSTYMRPDTSVIILEVQYASVSGIAGVLSSGTELVTIQATGIGPDTTIDDLKQLVTFIADGMIFHPVLPADSQNTSGILPGDFRPDSVSQNGNASTSDTNDQNITEETTSTQMDTVCDSIFIDEIQTTVPVPTGMKWATRSKGDMAFIEGTYKVNPGNLAAYMENKNHYLMAVHPDNQFRFDLSRIEMKWDEKNFSVLSDEEILQELDSQNLIPDIMTIQDQWIWRSEEYVFACSFAYSDIAGTYFLFTYTVLDGYMYMLLMRDEDPNQLKKMAEVLFQGFSVDIPASAQTLTLESCNNKTVTMPEKWSVLDQTMQTVENITQRETIDIAALVEDGTRRGIYLTIIDLLPLNPMPLGKGLPIERSSFDNVYKKCILDELLLGMGARDAASLKCGNREVTVFRTDSDISHASMIGINYAYCLRVEWFVPSGDAMSDTIMPALQDFVRKVLDQFSSYTVTW